jgi:hypothetical protein
VTASRWIESTFTATIRDIRASVGPDSAWQRSRIELVEPNVAVPIIVRWLVSFWGLSANVAVSSVVPPATSEQVVWVIAAALVVKIDDLAVMAYDPAATLAIVATVTSVVESAWLPSR